QRLVMTARQRAIDDHQNRLAQLEAMKAKAQALAEQANRDIVRSKIISPFDAKVARMLVSVGDRVRPGDPIVEVFDNTNLEVRAQIPLNYLAQIRQAIKEDKHLPAKTTINNQTVTMTLDRLASKVEQGRSGVDALFIVTNHAELLELGKTVSIFLELAEIPNTVLLPSKAIYGLRRIYLVVDNRLKSMMVERRGIVINEDSSQSILISSDQLKSGDVVITSQLPYAVDGLKVRVQKEDE
ncbi:MAG: efflux RND transporter periplasmic adaptor subunit, partial [Coxiellaceae bacterium]|nr:efflux RND transporter periplasmic adaptor subunit [Coxiellaceae bacterium]